MIQKIKCFFGLHDYDLVKVTECGDEDVLQYQCHECNRIKWDVV